MKNILFTFAALTTFASMMVLSPQVQAAKCNGPNGTSCEGPCCEVTANGCTAGLCDKPAM